ncbi:lipid-binding SYLF domain-containing protein [Hyphomonas sp.]|jgi:lipid-binding SYLF domain-containing protein|uniref:lipid-binding SYLF domain-containing protein n=1 Tax=Hyphomonas sp. TaxID=87 RepID=UPI0025C267B3|nr:lipid-binding SYLF domain-containing protein [Hyphomonas sp.]
MIKFRSALLAGCFAATASLGLSACSSLPDEVDRAQIDAGSRAALNKLVSENSAARAINNQARAVLVFPSMVKAGLGVGGAYGEGELIRNGATVDYYSSFTGSWGLQAGAQSYGYAVFLMNDEAVEYLEESDGWEIGVGPTVVLVNAGVAENLSTSTLKEDAYAFVFDQKGLMAGISIEGTKITKLH